MQSTDAPLDPPPRKAHFRRAVRNMRRAYRTLFAVIILVCAGWALLDAYRWNELSVDQRTLTVGFGLSALLAFVVFRFVENPLARELRLARLGYVAEGRILTITPAKRRRHGVTITYTFRTIAGATLEGRFVLPRRASNVTLEAGQAIEVLYDPARPRHNKPRRWLDYVDFGDPRKAGA
jgi:hypothetical protein